MAVPHRVPDLGALELLLAVIRLGSVGRAAAELGVSQPAASARIRSMERQMGVELLERSPRGSRPTEAGALVATWAQRVLDAAHEMDAGLAALPQRRGLRIMASPTVAEHLLPGWLVALDTTYPDASITLRTAGSTTVAEQVRLGKADLGFVEGARNLAGLSGTVVGSDRLVVVVASGHPWARRRSGVSAEELAAVSLILRADGTRAVLDRALASFGGTARPLVEPASTAELKAAAVSGTGPAVVSELAVFGELSGGRLVTVPVDDLDLSRPLRAVWPAGRRPSGPARDLLALIRRSRSRPAP
ncbi:transcriptional regulator [Actinomadura sp. NBRC 104412]|uniref:LysR family transcriptional regulator n=1 Tax=Actinomadura sp. NBRC 104412 TaxID=3032203 RepID=UPI0024A4544A|nr:LysR family transcriptional regulator [Actinomadura sp. NBRC 104412]GLZ05522.1 transcriptional regulator [Actinomadura sp. NBRC 104412]